MVVYGILKWGAECSILTVTGRWYAIAHIKYNHAVVCHCTQKCTQKNRILKQKQVQITHTKQKKIAEVWVAHQVYTVQNKASEGLGFGTPGSYMVKATLWQRITTNTNTNWVHSAPKQRFSNRTTEPVATAYIQFTKKCNLNQIHECQEKQ